MIYNFEQFLLEKKNTKRKSYGCVMMFFKNAKLNSILSKIKNEDIYDKEGYGKEKEPHITLLYGLHDDEIKSKDVFDACKIDINPVVLHKVSLFENDDYDVLKFDVKYKDKDSDKFLHKINKKLCKLPNTQTYPKYHPHSTICYLKKGHGDKYVKMFKDLEITVEGTKIVYSKSDNTREIEKIHKI